MLEEAGEFYPFGASLSQNGQISEVGGYNGEEHPQSEQIYNLLTVAFSSGARSGQLLGAALAANVNIPAQFSPASPDGIRVHIESLGYSRFVYFPYKLKISGIFKKTRLVELGEPFAVEVLPTFFAGTYV